MVNLFRNEHHSDKAFSNTPPLTHTHRTTSGQIAIIKIALDHYGDDLRMKAQSDAVRNVWLCNVDKYLSAVKEGRVNDLRLPKLKNEGPVDFNTVLAEVLKVTSDQQVEVQQDGRDDQSIDDEGSIDDSWIEGEENDDLVLTPRSYRIFYNTLLHDMRLWKRPPHNHCERCAEFETAKNRLTELQTAILSLPGSVEYNKHSEIVGRAGGPVKAWEEVRNLQIKLPDLQKHVTWDRTARAHLKTVEKTMPVTTTVWQLDYGGVNDSAGNKVSVWSATIISAPATGRKQEHFDFFFDQAPSKDKFTDGTAKKDGLTGIFMLGEMLDPEKSPKGDGVSLFATHYPENEEIILSGDTGNGYRAYQMLEELSKVFTKYGYRNKLIPLAPGHAWNRTDARIAHMNTMLNIILATSRVFGAIGIAATFRAASDPRLRDQRKFMARSHIFFVVVKVDREEAVMQKKLLGSHVFSPRLHGGKMGVRGFLYFDFSVSDDSGRTAHVPGFARVREHADPDMPNNPTYVYTWRKDLASTICQRCSNEWQGPVRLQVHGCTKKNARLQ